MILRAQIFISTVIRTTCFNTIYERATQPKFLPEGPLSPIIRKYICLYFSNSDLQ